MEKYSRFRDSGTGIQVFLTPVPPATGSALAHVLLVPRILLGAVRLALVAVIAAVWSLFTVVLGTAGRSIRGTLHAIFGRLILLLLGFSAVDTENVSLKSRGRATALSTNRRNDFQPQRGDIVLSNFSSWIDVLIAAITFNPIFLLPVVASGTSTSAASQQHAKPSPARRRNAGASVVTEANAKTSAAAERADTSAKRFLGFRRVTLLQAIRHAGKTPIVSSMPGGKKDYQDLAEISKNADGPIMVFPELVTSNNRGLLRLAPVFPPSWRDLYRVTGALRLGAGQANLLIMSIKHDPPTPLCATSTLSVPSSSALWNPLAHLWALASSLSFTRGVQVRLLDPAESPTSGAYAADASAGVVSATGEDALTEAIANLISSLSRLRRTGLGWEDKEAFLDMYQGQRSRR